MPNNVLTEETLHLPRYLAEADGGTVQRGRTLFQQGRARLREVGPQLAVLTVQGSREYRVRFWMEGGTADSTCDCPVADDEPGVLCKHQIAAAFTLHNHLHLHPPQTWEAVLARAVMGQGKRPAVASQLLLFSLQTRREQWAVFPYALPLSLFPDGPPAGDALLAAAIKKLKLSRQAKPVRSAGDVRRFVPTAGGEAAVLALGVLTGESYYYGYERSFDCRALLPLLAGGLVFRGREQDPLHLPLTVHAETASASVELRETPDGLALDPSVALGDHVFPLTPEKTAVVATGPLWLLSGAALFRAEDGGGLVPSLLDNPDITVPEGEREAFMDGYLLPLAERVGVHGAGVAWEEVADAAPVPRLYLSESGGEMAARLRFGYGDVEVMYDKEAPAAALLRRPETLTLVRVARRPAEEQGFWEAACGHGLKRGPVPGEFVLRARVDPVDFLLRHVPRLAEAGFEIYGERELTSARVNRSRPTISFNVSSGIDWFDVDAVAQFGDTHVALKDIRRAVRRRESYVKLADGTIGEIPPEWLEQYRYLFSLAEETDGGLRLAGAQVTLLDQLLLEGDRVEADDQYRQRRAQLLEFSHIEPRPVAAGLKAQLRPYQKAGVDWLHFLHDYGFGGCLADDMGTGKTVQCLAFLQSLSEDHKATATSLLVVPRSLVFNWEREAARFTPGLRLLNHARATRAKDLSGFDDYDLVVTTYGLLRRDIEMLRGHRFHCVILDEAQAIKNPLSLGAKSARRLQADHRLTLTGTPVENSTVELWSQFAFLNPGLLGGFDSFREDFAGPIERKQDEAAARFLRRLVHPFILRRTKAQVASDLPPRTERVLYVEMEPAQRRLYAETRDRFRSQILGLMDGGEGAGDARMKILEGLLRLRQIANHPRLVEPDSRAASGKFETLMGTLDTLRAEGHKVLIFSQFVRMLHLIRDALDARSVRYAYLDGSTRDRQGQVDAFQSDPALGVFLVSLKAGGVGLNLTAADYVIHVDPWWNPAAEAQATDRAHRIGQDKPVFVYKLIARETVEEKILTLQDRKRALVSQLIAAEGGVFKSLTRTDIEALFK